MFWTTAYSNGERYNVEASGSGETYEETKGEPPNGEMGPVFLAARLALSGYAAFAPLD